MSCGSVTWCSFESREEAANAAASIMSEALLKKLAESDSANLVVSGGSSPKACFEILSEIDLPWSNVSVSLTDERLVPVSDPASNEKMVRETLLNSSASDARFVPVQDTDEAFLAVTACALIGVGEDGHFASIFPDLDARESLLDVRQAPGAFEIQTAASEHSRITMNLSALLRAEKLLLLAFGEKKKEVLQQPDGLPVSHLLGQTDNPVTVLWAP